jgi:hypothetical protein
MQGQGVVALTLVGGLALSACNKDDNEIRYEAELDGTGGPTVVVTAARGDFTLVDNGSTMTWTLNVRTIQNVTQAHIHWGATGHDGSVLVDLLPNGPPSPAFTDGMLSTGTIDPSDILGLAGAAPISMDSLRALMSNNNAYVNVHTSANPGGHIRGQLRRDN